MGEKIVSEVMPPTVLTVMGTGDGLVKGTQALTPPDQPNIVVNVVRPFVGLMVRFGHNYFAAIVTLLTASMLKRDVIPATDFWHLFWTCAGLALGGTVLMSLKDIVTVLGKLEQKYPLWTGNV